MWSYRLWSLWYWLIILIRDTGSFFILLDICNLDVIWTPKSWCYFTCTHLKSFLLISKWNPVRKYSHYHSFLCTLKSTQYSIYSRPQNWNSGIGRLLYRDKFCNLKSAGWSQGNSSSAMPIIMDNWFISKFLNLKSDLSFSKGSNTHQDPLLFGLCNLRKLFKWVLNFSLDCRTLLHSFWYDIKRII